MALDFTVVSPFAKSVRGQDHLKKYYDLKVKKYENIIKNADYVFQPMVLDSLGNIEDEAVQIIKKVANCFSLSNKQDRGKVLNLFLQKLSVILVKSVAVAIFDRLPKSCVRDIEVL